MPSFASKAAALERAVGALLQLDSEIEPAGYLRSLLQTLKALTVIEVLDAMKQPPGSGQSRLHVLKTNEDRLALAELSERELEVVRLVAEGLSNKEISARLSLSDKTVKNHLSHILAKMGLSARTQVAVCALRAGLL